MGRHRVASSLIVLALGGCAASTEQPLQPSSANGKRELVRRMEAEMSDLVRAAKPRVEAIHQSVVEKLNRITPPMRLQVVDEVLSHYGQQAEAEFITKIDAVVEEGVKQVDDILKRLEAEVHKKAYQVARNDLPTESEFTTGYTEIDDIAHATMDQAQRMADREGLRDLGYFRRGEVIRFTRVLRVDTDKLGRLSLFLSPPVHDKVLVGQESVGVVAAAQRKGIGNDVPLRLVQAARHQILRDGVPVHDLGWRLDPNTPNHDGIIPIDDTIKEPSYVISRVGYPALRSDEPDFESFRDFTFLVSFELGVQRTDTGELLAGCAYELRWRVTYNGQVILLEGHNARKRTDRFVVLEHLLKGQPVPAAADAPIEAPAKDAGKQEPVKQGEAEEGKPPAPEKQAGDEQKDGRAADAPAKAVVVPPPAGSEVPPAPAGGETPPAGEKPSGDTGDHPASVAPAVAPESKGEPAPQPPSEGEPRVEGQKTEPGEHLEMEVPPSAASKENALQMAWTISPQLMKMLDEKGSAFLDRYTGTVYSPAVKGTRLGIVGPKAKDGAPADAKPAMTPEEEKLMQDLGVRVGDILVSINKVPIASKSFLQAELKELVKTKQLEVVLLRDGEERTVRYQLPEQ